MLLLPSWVPIEKGGVLKEQLTRLEKQLGQITRGATRINMLVRQMQKFENRAARK